MKLLMIHLSDIHIKTEDNFIINKFESLIAAVQNECLEHDKIFILLTGDIAYSGKLEEYIIADRLLNKLIKKLKYYSKKEINILLIPGNHDCNHGNASSVRDVLVDSILKKDTKIDEEIIKQCCQVQNEWQDLYESHFDNEKVLFDSPLLKIKEYYYGDFKLIFYEYNTAWLSLKDENYGEIYYPFDYFPKEKFKNNADLSISLLHHPLNWQTQGNQYKFKTHIEETSDLVITGHEHISGQSERHNLKGNYTEYIEGAVLQDSNNESNSEFNLIMIDLKNEIHKAHKYSWDGDFYSCEDSSTGWTSYKKLHSDRFLINETFKETWLNDPGANFTHYKKSKLYLDDIFIWPDLEDINEERSEKDTYEDKVIDGNILKEISQESNRLLLLGEESCGKTTICKKIFKHYYNNGFIPVFIEGATIRSDTHKSFKKILQRKFTEQYTQEKTERFTQLSNNKKMIIIDDLNNSNLSAKYRRKFLKMLFELYPNVLITGDTLIQMEEIMQETESVLLFDSYEQYKIKEFGHFKREELIKKWHRLGQEKQIKEIDLMRKLDKSKSIINRIIGNNFIPSFPIYLLTILQTEHMGQSHNLKESTYGHYYSYLITQSLGKVGIPTDDLDLYYNYITELAFYMFETNNRRISENHFKEHFHDKFCKEYKINLNFENITKKLCQAALLENLYGNYEIKYKYIYYYFIAKYLANNISKEKIQLLIKDLCKSSYIEENANIILFLTHHSKDPLILDELIKNAVELFGDYEALQFNNDIKAINNLLSELPQLAYEEINVEKYRENSSRKKDEYEYNEKDEEEVAATKEDENNAESLSGIDYASRLNFSFKTIEILGQVLKNYYGSMKGDQKYKIGYNVYMLALRTLKSLFIELTDSKDYFINQICKAVEENGFEDKDEIKSLAGRLVFHFAEFISFSLIKKASSSIGTEKLKQTFEEIKEKNNSISVKLIDVTIKLDYFRAFPFKEVEELVGLLKNNLLPKSLLKRFVLDYLYMFDELDFRDKQRVCNLLGISMRAQYAISQKSKQKKNIK